MYRLVIASLSLFLSFAAIADEVVVPVGSQGDMTMERPKSGMTKAQVESHFGAPEKVNGPIGDPPITTWKYADFSVYFEYDKVIHSVLHKS